MPTLLPFSMAWQTETQKAHLNNTRDLPDSGNLARMAGNPGEGETGRQLASDSSTWTPGEMTGGEAGTDRISGRPDHQTA